MARPSPRAAVTAVLVAAATLLLTGCFSLESSVTVHDDGTADLRLVTVVDTTQFERLTSLFGEGLGPLGDVLENQGIGDADPCEELVGGLTDYDVTTETIDDEGEVGAGCTVANVPIEELTSVMSDVLQVGESTFAITQEGDATHFAATLEGVDAFAGFPDEMSQITDVLGIDLNDIFSITFTVTAPGSLGDNNATSTNGSTATWDVSPDADFVTDGQAVMTADWSGSSSSSSSTLWIILGIVLGIVVLAVIVGAIIYFVKRRKRGDSGGETPATAVTDGPVMTSPVPTGAPAAPTAPVASPSPFAPPPPPPTGSSSSPAAPPPPPPQAPPMAPPPPPPAR